MAQTTEPYDGNGTRGSAGNALSFTFPYLKLTDVKVALNGTTLATTEYTFPTATTLQFNTGSETTLQETSGAPKTGVSILIYRDTNVDSARHVFGQGSAFKSKDLNENKEQSLYFDQEVGDTANPKNFVTSAQISDGTSLSAADKTKLDTIETSAKDDQTGAEIKTLYEAENNTNAFTDAEKTKLQNVEANAKDDQTGSEIASLLSDQTINGANLYLSDDTPKIRLIDTNADDDFQISNFSGNFIVKDITNSVDRFTIQSDGTTVIANNLDVGAGLDVTGNISVSGTVDNRDLATDGTKLDGIEANAINASNTAITNKLPLAGGTMTGDLTLSGTVPKVIFNDTDGTNGYRLIANAGGFKIQDTANNNDSRLTIQSTGNVVIDNSLVVEGNLTVNGTTTTLNTETVNVDDKNFILNSITSPTDALANNGGFTLRGTTDKTFQWKDNTDSWTSSEHIALPDNKKLQLGASQDLSIYHTGAHTYITNSTGVLHLDNDGDVKIRASLNPNEDGVKVVKDAQVELFFDNNKKFQTTSTGTQINCGPDGDGLKLQGTTNRIDIVSNTNRSGAANTILELDAHWNNTSVAFIALGTGDDTTNKDDGRLRFFTKPSGGTITERLKIEPDGNVQIPADDKKLQIGANQDLEIFKDGNHCRIKDNQSANGFATAINTDHLRINNLANTENIANFVKDGACELFYDNSKKFSTSSSGVIFHGGSNFVNSNNGSIFWGTNTSAAYGSNAGIGIAQQSHYHITGSNAGDFCIAAKTGENINFGTKSSGSGVTTMSARILANKTFQIFTGNLQLRHDNQKLQIGASQDFNFFHDGDSRIENTTGDIKLKNSGDYFFFNNDGSETHASFINNGAVNLYFDGSKKLETSATGAKVTTTSAANSIRNITTSTSAPSGGSDGDLWFTYVA